MKTDNDGRIMLTQGESIPVVCIGCCEIYQPELGSEVSDCPCCKKVNVHGLQEWKLMPNGNITNR